MASKGLDVNIYVASSWRNQWQPEVVNLLRKEHEVYDFRNPEPGDEGFSWRDIDPSFPRLTVEGYKKALEHPLADKGYKHDMRALASAHLCILLLPSGRSASFEYGWWCADNKDFGLVHMPGDFEPELMYKGSLFSSTDTELLTNIDTWRRRRGLVMGA